MPNDHFDALLATLGKATEALNGAGVPFLLGGGLACWVRGGPETEHDLDLMVRPQDADDALAALAGAGFRPEKPPEGWLYKAWDGDVMVDLIFEPVGLPITSEVLARGELLEVNAIPMSVMTLEDVLVTKLLALSEHALDYDSVLEIGRSLREQIDWDEVRERTASSPYARAYFTLVDGLGIADVPTAGKPA